MRTSILPFVFAALVVTGCATTGGDFRVADANTALNEWSCKFDVKSEQDACIAAYGEDDIDAAKDRPLRSARLLRAHTVLVMFARYAAARYPEFSDDISSDAARMIGRLEYARGVLKELEDLAQKTDIGSGFYAVDRVDGFVALVDVSVAATQPTRHHLIKLAVISSPADRVAQGPELLKNALKDILYLDGYKVALEQTRRSVGSDQAKLDAAIKVLDDQLKTYCGKLGDMAKLKNKTCLPS